MVISVCFELPSGLGSRRGPGPPVNGVELAKVRERASLTLCGPSPMTAPGPQSAPPSRKQQPHPSGKS